jgi:Tfp pilus assembly protein PilO
MSFRKLPKEKRNLLMLVAVGTLLVIAALYCLVISRQNQDLARLAQKQISAKANQRRILDAIRRANEIEADLASAKQALADSEADVASGDLYSWVINTLRQFKANYKVNIPQFSPIGAVTEVNLLPDFPYKQTTFSLSGTAHYHDFGRFLADLENQFPHVRVVNLNLELNPSPVAEDQETISFKLDMVTLLKPNAS